MAKPGSAFAAIGATVAAVVAALVIPPWLSASAPVGPSVPDPPTPTERAVTPGDTTWQTIRCQPADGDRCVTPSEIDHGGAMFFRAGGRRMAVGDASSARVLRVTVPRSQRDRWVLVGADGAGADSRITVGVGDADQVTVPPGRLSLFPLPGHRPLVVTVAELGAPRDHEVLHIQQYMSH
jgi:hypothetical protein